MFSFSLSACSFKNCFSFCQSFQDPTVATMNTPMKIAAPSIHAIYLIVRKKDLMAPIRNEKVVTD